MTIGGASASTTAWPPLACPPRDLGRAPSSSLLARIDHSPPPPQGKIYPSRRRSRPSFECTSPRITLIRRHSASLLRAKQTIGEDL